MGSEKRPKWKSCPKSFLYNREVIDKSVLTEKEVPNFKTLGLVSRTVGLNFARTRFGALLSTNPITQTIQLQRSIFTVRPFLQKKMKPVFQNLTVERHL